MKRASSAWNLNTKTTFKSIREEFADVEKYSKELLKKPKNKFNFEIEVQNAITDAVMDKLNKVIADKCKLAEDQYKTLLSRNEYLENVNRQMLGLMVNNQRYLADAFYLICPDEEFRKVHDDIDFNNKTLVMEMCANMLINIMRPAEALFECMMGVKEYHLSPFKIRRQWEKV